MHLSIGGAGAEVIGLTMRAVYADVIEGIPDREINDRTVAWAVKQAGQRHHAPVLLVPPVQRPCGPARDGRSPPVALPNIECTARVRGPRVSPDADFAELAVVWYQDKLETTVPLEVSSYLASASWAAHAKDVYW